MIIKYETGGIAMANVLLLTGCNTVFGVVIAKKFLENDWFVVSIYKESECAEQLEIFTKMCYYVHNILLIVLKVAREGEN